MSAEHTAAEDARTALYGRMHLQTGTLDTSGYGESSLTTVAVVYQDGQAAPAPDEAVEPEPVVGWGPDGPPAPVTDDTLQDGQEVSADPVDDDPSRDMDPFSDDAPDQDDTDAGAPPTQDPAPEDPEPPVVEEPSAAKVRPPGSGRKRRAADSAAG